MESENSSLGLGEAKTHCRFLHTELEFNQELARLFGSLQMVDKILGQVGIEMASCDMRRTCSQVRRRRLRDCMMLRLLGQ